MHVPDGFLDVQTSVATGIVAATAVVWRCGDPAPSSTSAPRRWLV